MIGFAGILLGVSFVLTPQKAVEIYLEGLERAIKEGKAAFVQEVAEKKLVTKLQIWLDAWRFSGYSSSAKLLEFKVKDVKIEDRSAVVITSERWEYSYAYLDTGEIALPPRKVFYEIIYKLRRHGDGWRIEEIEILKEVNEDGCGPDCER